MTVDELPRYLMEHWQEECVHTQQWKRGPRTYAELRKLDVPPIAAARVAAHMRRWWHNAATLIHLGVSTRYYDRLGVPRLAD